MRIDNNRAGKVSRRKGLPWRPFMAAAWFFTCVICAYLVTGWLFSSQVVQADLIHASLSIAPDVSMIVVRLTSTVLLVATLHYTAMIFFATTNATSKVRPGRPTSAAQKPDYGEQQYNRRA